MSSRPADLHADWLRLVESEGQFLSLPVLRRAFPDGLESIQTSIREQLRERYPHEGIPSQAQWNSWIDWLMRDALAWGAYYHTGEDTAAYSHAVPEHNIVLRADRVLCDPDTDKPRVLVMRYPHGTALDRRINGDHWNTSPIDRLALLCRAQGVRIGLATDGERIALAWVPTAGVGGHATWDTSLFTESRERNLLQSFVSLLHASRFFAVQDNLRLEALFEASEKAQSEVTGQLGFQVRQAVELLVSALSRSDLERDGKLLAGVAPQTVYEAAATVMMRLIFLLYAEERDLLQLGDPLYAEHYAASTLRDQLNEQAAVEGDEPLERRGSAWHRLLALFRVIYGGINHDRLRVPAYGGRLFDPDRFAFLEGRIPGEPWSSVAARPLPVDDLTVRAILEAIQTLPIRESGSRERRRLSFRSLDVEQIGHVYEGLLDHGAVRVDDVYLGLVGKTGDEAEIPLADLENVASQGQHALIDFVSELTGKSASAVEKLLECGRMLVDGKDADGRRRVNTVCDNDAALAKRVSPFVYALRMDLRGLPVVFPSQSLVVKKTRARRDSGTEYTPRQLAEEMVRYALEPLAYSPGPRDGVEPSEWRLRTSDELLNLKICDPAAGSGAFLVSACRYLADRVVEAWILERSERATAERDELTLDARRAVVDRCLYGVDRDPMAVEMSKLSLWLVTMARERPFSFLDHSIREGDSLLGISSLEQLRFFHFDPSAGEKLHSQTHIDVRSVIQPLVERATELRRELEALPSMTVRDSEQKRRLNDEATGMLREIGVLADGVVATGFATATATEHKRQSAFKGLASLAASALDLSHDQERRLDAFDRLRSRNEQMLNAGRPEAAPPRKTLHWPLAFPEVFLRDGHPGFDAMIGNPPFLGGQKISGALGLDFREYLIRWIAENRRGTADLVSYFFLQCSKIATRLAFVAVTTIAEGDTREVGLDALVGDGWRILRAVPSVPWPGSAAVHIAKLWLTKEATNEQASLSNERVTAITTSLSRASRASGIPYKLSRNRQIAFIGSYVLGLGFTMTPSEASTLITRDPQNADVLFPYLNGRDLNSSPTGQASRWIINFRDWSIDRAQRYPYCFGIVETRVKPERQNGKIASRRDRWWRYAAPAASLYNAIEGFARVLAITLTSRTLMPMFVAGNQVFDQKLVIFADNSDYFFGLVTSEVHRIWALDKGSKLKDDPNYTVEDCFETFPRPRISDDRIAAQGAKLSAFRSNLMANLGVGLTTLYNRVHDQNNHATEIADLRAIHANLDRAVLRSYNWSDLDPAHGFFPTRLGIRYTFAPPISREVLDRLMELNHLHYREELSSHVVTKSKGVGQARLVKETASPNNQLGLV